MFHICCMSIHKLLYFGFFSTSFCRTFLYARIAHLSVCMYSLLFLIIKSGSFVVHFIYYYYYCCCCCCCCCSLPSTTWNRRHKNAARFLPVGYLWHEDLWTSDLNQSDQQKTFERVMLHVRMELVCFTPLSFKFLGLRPRSDHWLCLTALGLGINVPGCW